MSDDLIIELKLLKILGDSAKSIKRRKKQIGSVGGDTDKSFAFDVYFVDYEKQNNKNAKGYTLDNMDFWMPKIREHLNVYESYFHDSNYATIWICK